MRSVMFSSKRPSGEEKTLLELIAERYASCHPGDSFPDLMERASFSKEDRRLMQDWLDAGRFWRRR